jgi:TP53 regulating kinase and related kinases
MEFIAQGAESVITGTDGTVVKERARKSYRIPELDGRIRKTRTKREARMLDRLYKLGLPVPKVIRTEECRIFMEKIEGPMLKQCIEESEDPGMIFHDLGILVSRLHRCDVVHGDLTTSNFILGSGKMHVLDFGLAFISAKDEDKAVDLYVFERAVACAHDAKHLEDFYRGYAREGAAEVLKRLESVRMRGRKREEAMAG